MFKDKNSNQFHTTFGLLLSLAIFILSITFAFLFGRDIYERKLPIVNDVKEAVSVNSTAIYLNKFPFVVYFTDKYGKIIEADILKDLIDFDIMFVYFDFYISIIKTRTTKGLQLCSKGAKEYYKDATPAYRDYVNFVSENYPNGAFCIMPDLTATDNYTDAFYFDGEFASANSVFFNMRVFKCNKNKSKCSENLDDYLTEMFVVTYFQNAYTVPYNYTNPVKIYTDSVTQQLNKMIYKRNYIRFTTNVIDTDVGWVLEEKHENYYISQKDLLKDADIAFDDRIYSLNVSSSTIRLRTIRIYLRFQDILAKIGGFFYLILFFGNILISNYTEFKFYVSIAKTITNKENERSVLDIVNKLKNDYIEKYNMFKQVSSSNILKMQQKNSLNKNSNNNLLVINEMSQQKESNNNIQLESEENIIKVNPILKEDDYYTPKISKKELGLGNKAYNFYSNSGDNAFYVQDFTYQSNLKSSISALKLEDIFQKPSDLARTNYSTSSYTFNEFVKESYKDYYIGDIFCCKGRSKFIYDVLNEYISFKRYIWFAKDQS